MKAMTNLDRVLEKAETKGNKGLYGQSYGFSSSHVQIWDLNPKESWAPKNWCFQAVVLEETLESPLDSKETNQSILKEISPEQFIRRTVAEAEASVFWPSEAKSWLNGKDPNVGKDWRQKEKGMAEDEIAR